ncbi:MAG: DUF533 domain-containing protein [Vicinamibacteria bacterium]|jgi:uncharacterized membrane protein YebE (DUF533 family)|nr:DUF533 domain-containing protein [Vicinamibacteria bacterium]MBP9945528.1 DUF533 domain-containing protein [Vicinamibacteria bacterium]
MFNPEQLLGQLLKSGLSGGFGKGRKRKRGGSMLGGMSTGAKAQIGMGLLGVAIAAYEHYSQKSSAPSSPSPTPSPGSGAAGTPQSLAPMPRTSLGVASGITPAPAGFTDAMLLVQAMVAAAAADGVVDDEEKAQMLRRANEAGFDDETKRFLEAELANPKSLAVIAASARPELATDVYAASCAAITADTDAERAYLDTLAKRLNLSEETRAEVHRHLEMA